MNRLFAFILGAFFFVMLALSVYGIMASAYEARTVIIPPTPQQTSDLIGVKGYPHIPGPNIEHCFDNDLSTSLWDCIRNAEYLNDPTEEDEQHD